MAKMFYTLEETAEKLGVSPDEVKQMADSGQIQQFRDRDKLMFKREQVDDLLGKSRTTKLSSDTISLDDADEIKLSDDLDTRASKTDSIDLMAETAPGDRTAPGAKSPTEEKKKRTATGISVFDADEIEAADPMAQTQVTGGFGDQDLTLDSVGSGSGLLDLTRESDETSLGAVELLEDAGEEKQTTSLGGMPSSSTGIFEQPVPPGGSVAGAAAMDLEPAGEVYVVSDEGGDPAGDGFGGGMMLGVFITLVIATIIMVTGMQGNITELTRFFAADGNAWMYAAGLGVLSLILGAVGFFIGKSRTA